MPNYDHYHVTLPAKVAGTSVAAEIQTAADAYNAAVDAKGPCCAESIEASKTYRDKLNEGLKEVGIDLASIM